MFTERTLATNPKSPLCDLRDLCAMLSLGRVLARTRAVFTGNFGHRRKSPLCGLRDLCAMLSSLARVLARNARVFTERTIATTPISPSVASVTSVRCFFSFDEFSHRSRAVHNRGFFMPSPCRLRSACPPE